MDNCRLCFDRSVGNRKEYWNEPLFEFRNFIVVPSLGALVEGWLLVVPKAHFICLGAMPDLLITEIQEIKHSLCVSLQEIFGQIAAFEHGPCKSNQSVGCSVDHAHLHLVPIAFDLIPAVTPFLPKDTHWYEAGVNVCCQTFRRGEDYLYLEQPIGAGRIALSKGFGGQLFRRAIAEKIGSPARFNWREYPQHPNVLSTIDRVRVLGDRFSATVRARAIG